MWFKLNAHFFGLERDLFFYIYISPSNSSFVQKMDLDKQIFSKLEADITIMLMGDLNAHINYDEHDFIINSVAANIKNSPKYFTCGDKHEIWHTYLSDNTVSKIIIGHRDFRHFQDGCR
jgi:hypothetical protein